MVVLEDQDLDLPQAGLEVPRTEGRASHVIAVQRRKEIIRSATERKTEIEREM